jgi:hypothetical protein
VGGKASENQHSRVACQQKKPFSLFDETSPTLQHINLNSRFWFINQKRFRKRKRTGKNLREGVCKGMWGAGRPKKVADVRSSPSKMLARRQPEVAFKSVFNCISASILAKIIFKF